MKKMMLIGKTYSGKTTLCQNINSLNISYKKTQSVEFYGNIIDTPGEYIENKRYYKALIVTSVDVDVIALVQDITDESNLFPPEFASIFSKPVIGIITKIDSKESYEKENESVEKLKLAGVDRIFKVSSIKSEGIEELIDYLK